MSGSWCPTPSTRKYVAIIKIIATEKIHVMIVRYLGQFSTVVTRERPTDYIKCKTALGEGELMSVEVRSITALKGCVKTHVM